MNEFKENNKSSTAIAINNSEVTYQVIMYGSLLGLAFGIGINLLRSKLNKKDEPIKRKRNSSSKTNGRRNKRRDSGQESDSDEYDDSE